MYKKGIISLVAATTFLISGCQSEEKADSKTVETEKGSNQEAGNNNAVKTTEGSGSTTSDNTSENKSEGSKSTTVDNDNTVKGSGNATDTHKNDSQPVSSNKDTTVSSNSTSNNTGSPSIDTAGLLMSDYIGGLTDAINTGRFDYYVSDFIEGSLYNQQKSLVSKLYKQGIKERWEDYSLVSFNKTGESSKGSLYKIATRETVTIIKPDGSQATKKYNWMYSAIYHDDHLFLTDIAKNGPITTVSESKATNNQNQSTDNQTVTNSPAPASKKEEYLYKLDHTKDMLEASATSENDMERKQQYNQNYQLWDGLLNEIYGVLKTQLSASEMSTLQSNQRQWIESRDAAAQATFDEEGGGTLSQAEQVRTLWEVTRDRCYILVNNYMK
ncbi:lysozyme inhibitor LprI family protein [Priestia aryabhattai]|uniref:lysozyme inhibitor LprI family protein n=1 Tax=Priestia aryabhattai TaxID=412384 RepID=UPI00203B7EC8|nr:lysozyme inhibitor LprI family protein [Priestia aryabhattai]MCM2978951.1 lysozyme inhibitor LprI family protein [Priestia aryabhattai]MED3950183.1 lysozyme inhibitor LprI family protein [Priestia aryabhattai]